MSDFMGDGMNDLDNFMKEWTTPSLKLLVKYLQPSLIPIGISPNADWIDLRVAKDVDVTVGGHFIIPLGVCIKLPEGYEAHLVVRSSTFKNYGIIQTNSHGVVDNAYCGDEDEWKLSVYATRNSHISFNDRICQFRIVEKQPVFDIVKVESLGSVSRGGFGSTGIK
jgi:dUTP pyrophosphatase